MRVFGCAWKIYFSEIIWSWLGKWAFDHGNGLKWKFSLQTIFGTEAQRERERERESARMREEARSRLWRRRWSPDRRFRVRRSHTTIRRSRGSPDRTLQSDNRTLQSDDREEAQIARSSPTIDLAFDLAPLDLASARSRLRPTDLSLWFWFLLLLCGGVVVVFWWLWLLIARICCRGLNWSFGGVWCWLWFWNFFNKICLDAEKIVKKMWKICRKIAFSE